MADVEVGSTETLDEDKSEKYVENHFLVLLRKKIWKFLLRNWFFVNVTMTVLFHSCVILYICVALHYWYYNGPYPMDWCNGVGSLIIIAVLYYWCLVYYKIFKPRLTMKCGNISTSVFSSRYCKKLLYTVPPVAFATFIIYDSYPKWTRLIPLAGTFTFIFGGFIFSKYPSKIQWSIIYRGISMQICIALLTIRWRLGREFLNCIGTKVEHFLANAYVGAGFVYGEDLVTKLAVFAFQSLSVIFFMGFIVEILFYYNVLQKVFITLGWALQNLIGTTVIESINCCASVFLGLSEAPLMIKPYLKDLTMSELQAVTLGLLSTVAGSVFAAYISFGINSGYLITASIMSAPAALTFSKLIYPETEVSKTKSENIDIHLPKNTEGVLSAACHGALSCIPIVQGVITNLIVFISFIAFLNHVLSWMGMLVGLESLTLDVILSKLLIPVALLLGVRYEESEYVARLIALKATINEFVAYKELGMYKKSNLLSPRTEVIATYALCSFSNPNSVGAVIAILSSICPERQGHIIRLMFRAYIGGIVTCFMTASIAAVLTEE